MTSLSNYNTIPNSSNFIKLFKTSRRTTIRHNMSQLIHIGSVDSDELSHPVIPLCNPSPLLIFSMKKKNLESIEKDQSEPITKSQNKQNKKWKQKNARREGKWNEEIKKRERKKESHIIPSASSRKWKMKSRERLKLRSWKCILYSSMKVWMFWYCRYRILNVCNGSGFHLRAIGRRLIRI